MAITDENGTGMVMPVAPMYGNGNNGGCGFGNDWGWIILLLLFAGGGWGNGFGGGGYGSNLVDFPWLMNGQQGINANTNNGFQNAMLNDNITSVRDGISALSTQICNSTGDISTQLCGGFAGVNASINGAQNAIAQQMYSNQIADLERSFAAQTANTQAISGLSSQLAQCCCDNRLATCQTQNIIQNEGNATRFADANNTRDIIDATTRGNQMILDKLCQLELDGVKAQVEAKNDRISELQSQLNMAALRESQTAQNAFISQGFANEVDQLYNRLNNCPVPTTPVYGRTPIFTCNQNNGCGCGCGM
jgi:hypothetical protein